MKDAFDDKRQVPGIELPGFELVTPGESIDALERAAERLVDDVQVDITGGGEQGRTHAGGRGPQRYGDLFLPGHERCVTAVLVAANEAL